MEIQAKLIEIVEKPYSVNGNEGISYRLRFLTSEDEIISIKSNRDQCSNLKPYFGKVGKLTLSLSVRKEDVTLSVASFTAKV